MSARRDKSWIAGLVPYAWLILLFAFPFILVFKLSLSDVALSIPPYTPQMKDCLPAVLGAVDGETYARLTGDPLYVRAWLSSLKIAAISTMLSPSGKVSARA